MSPAAAAGRRRRHGARRARRRRHVTPARPGCGSARSLGSRPRCGTRRAARPAHAGQLLAGTARVVANGWMFGLLGVIGRITRRSDHLVGVDDVSFVVGFVEGPLQVGHGFCVPDGRRAEPAGRAPTARPARRIRSSGSPGGQRRVIVSTAYGRLIGIVRRSDLDWPVRCSSATGCPARSTRSGRWSPRRRRRERRIHVRRSRRAALAWRRGSASPRQRSGGSASVPPAGIPHRLRRHGFLAGRDGRLDPCCRAPQPP